MAVVNQILHRKNSSGSYDTIYLQSNMANVTGTLAVANGGTGATNAEGARSNLGAAASNHSHTASQVTFENATLYTIGDDVAIGDQNVAGTLIVQGVNGNGDVQLRNSNGSIRYKIGDEIDNLKSSVSNGKAAVASAITDKGVSTSATASFDTMSNNIRSIQTGITPKGTPGEYIVEGSTIEAGDYVSFNVGGLIQDIPFTSKTINTPPSYIKFYEMITIDANTILLIYNYGRSSIRGVFGTITGSTVSYSTPFTLYNRSGNYNDVNLGSFYYKYLTDDVIIMYICANSETEYDDGTSRGEDKCVVCTVSISTKTLISQITQTTNVYCYISGSFIEPSVIGIMLYWGSSYKTYKALIISIDSNYTLSLKNYITLNSKVEECLKLSENNGIYTYITAYDIDVHSSSDPWTLSACICTYNNNNGTFNIGTIQNITTYTKYQSGVTGLLRVSDTICKLLYQHEGNGKLVTLTINGTNITVSSPIDFQTTSLPSAIINGPLRINDSQAFTVFSTSPTYTIYGSLIGINESGEVQVYSRDTQILYTEGKSFAGLTIDIKGIHYDVAGSNGTIRQYMAHFSQTVRKNYSNIKGVAAESGSVGNTITCYKA